MSRITYIGNTDPGFVPDAGKERYRKFGYFIDAYDGEPSDIEIKFQILVNKLVEQGVLEENDIPL